MKQIPFLMGWGWKIIRKRTYRSYFFSIQKNLIPTACLWFYSDCKKLFLPLVLFEIPSKMTNFVKIHEFIVF